MLRFSAHISSSLHNLKSAPPPATSTLTSTTRNLMKTLFHSGLMNMARREHGHDDDDDERTFRENYCDLWVLHGSSATPSQQQRRVIWSFVIRN
jgi:hypothetical protein